MKKLPRAEQFRIIHEIDQAILATHGLQDVAQAAAHGLGDALGAAYVCVIGWDLAAGNLQVLATYNPGRQSNDTVQVLPLTAWPDYAALCRSQMVAIKDLTSVADPPALIRSAIALGAGSLVALPILFTGLPLGGLLVGFAEPGLLPAAVVEPAQHVAASLAVAMHSAQLFEELRQKREELQVLSRRLVQIQETERRSISRELHDETGQGMTVLKLGLSMLAKDAACTMGMRTQIDELQRTVDSLMEGLHRLAVDLRPSSLDRYGLVAAIEQYIAAFRMQQTADVSFAASGMDGERLEGEVESALYRVVQEALTNVARHAQAEHVNIMLTRAAGRVVVIVADDGQGFDVEAAAEGARLGLLGMHERTQMLGGTLVIESKPGDGTLVCVEVPDHTEHAAEKDEHDSDSLRELEDRLKRRADDLLHAGEELRVQQAAMERERALLRSMMHTSPDCVFMKDLESRFITTNSAHLRILGRSSIDEVIGKTDFDFFPLTLAAQYFADEQMVVSTGRPLLNREELVVDAAGDEHWMLVSKVPLLNDRGDVTGLVGLSRDITERRQAEKMVEEQRARLEILHEIDQAILGATEPEEIAHVALRHLRNIIPCDRAALTLVDSEAGHAELLAVETDGDTGIPEGTVFSLVNPEMQAVYAEAEPQVYPDLDALPNHNSARQLLTEGLHSHMRIPMVAHGRVIGALSLTSAAIDAFTPNMIEIARPVATSVAVAMQHALLRRQLAASVAQDH